MKINCHQKVNQQNGKSDADTQSDVGAIHAPHLSPDHHRAATREMLLHVVNNFLNLLRDRPQIAVLGISINIKHRLDVVMADDDRSSDVLDRRQIAEKLGLRTAIARESP